MIHESWAKPENSLITTLQGSTYIGDLRVGGMGSRILSNLVTCGGSSELMNKRDRRRLCLPETMEILKAELNRLLFQFRILIRTSNLSRTNPRYEK